MLFYIIGIGRILCPLSNILSAGEIESRNSTKSPYVTIFGNYYKIDQVLKDHVQVKQLINSLAFESTVLGQDVSPMFYKTSDWSSYCSLPQPSGWDELRRVFPEKSKLVWFPHNAKQLSAIKGLKRGVIARDSKWIAGYLSNDPNNAIVTAYGRVYDITTYNDLLSNNFLGTNFKRIFDANGNRGSDISKYLDSIKQSEGKDLWLKKMQCIDGLFFTGVIDTRNSSQCVISNYILLASTIILVLVIIFKFIAAIKITSGTSPEQCDKFIVISMPCYTEGRESLLVSLERIALSKYPDSKKLIMVICDGMIVGTGNDKATPLIVLDILGVPKTTSPATVYYTSIGEGSKTCNRANVYSGFYKIEGRVIPFIVVVKIGDVGESYRPGNRGKRDSQLILMQYFSKVFYNSLMDPLQLELCVHFGILGLDPCWFEFMMMVDADTEVLPESVNGFVSAMQKDQRIIGICGETLVENENASWVTMMQVISINPGIRVLYISSHGKSFREYVWRCNMSPRLFLLLSNKERRISISSIKNNN